MVARCICTIAHRLEERRHVAVRPSNVLPTCGYRHEDMVLTITPRLLYPMLPRGISI